MSDIMAVVIGGLAGQCAQRKCAIASAKQSSQANEPLDVIVLEIDARHEDGGSGEHELGGQEKADNGL